MFPHVLNGYAYPTKTNNKFTVNLDTLPKNPETYYLESLRAAELVWDQRQGKVYLLYSGGVDSEYTFNLFLSLGMPVIPVILCLKPDYNTHDISYALDFCESKNIKPVIIDLDFDKFVDSGKFLEISIAAQSEIYHLAATAWAAEQLYGTVLMGDGEPYIKLQPDKTWNVEIMEFDYAITRYFEKKGIYGLPHFNIYTPGQFSSFIQDPRMRELANNEHPGKLGSHSDRKSTRLNSSH